MREVLQRYLSVVVEHIKRLRDVRVLGLDIFIVIALLVTWNSVGVIQTNYELQQQLARLEQENEIKKLQNDTLSLRNQYFETDQFLELAARKQFSKAAPGETVLLVPESVAYEYAPELERPEQAPLEATEKPVYQQNFEAWMEFFFRRQTIFENS